MAGDHSNTSKRRRPTTGNYLVLRLGRTKQSCWPGASLYTLLGVVFASLFWALKPGLCKH